MCAGRVAPRPVEIRHRRSAGLCSVCRPASRLTRVFGPAPGRRTSGVGPCSAGRDTRPRGAPCSARPAARRTSGRGGPKVISCGANSGVTYYRGASFCVLISNGLFWALTYYREQISFCVLISNGTFKAVTYYRGEKVISTGKKCRITYYRAGKGHAGGNKFGLENGGCLLPEIILISRCLKTAFTY